MLLFTPGKLLKRKVLNDILRERHNQIAEGFNAHRDRRAADGLPISEEKGSPLASHVAHMEPWVDDDDLSKVSGQVVNLTLKEVTDAQADFDATDSDEDTSDDQRRANAVARTKVMRAFVAKAWANVDGFAAEDGPLPTMGASQRWHESDLDLLEHNGLLLVFWQAGIYALSLHGERRGNCGASQPTSSRSAAATPAPSNSESSGDATKTGSMSGLKEPPSSLADAPAPSFERTQTSTPSYDSTPTRTGV